MTHPANIVLTASEARDDLSPAALAQSLWLIRAAVRRHGHNLGAAVDGCAECHGCGAVMVDSDALAWFKGADDSVLGAFERPCSDDPVCECNDLADHGDEGNGPECTPCWSQRTSQGTRQPCRGCGEMIPFDPDCDFCPDCLDPPVWPPLTDDEKADAENMGEVA